MTDDRFEEFLREHGRTYREPPETPREQMWARIQAVRAQPPIPVRPWRGLQWGGGLAAAALLVIGFAIGRFSTAPAEDEPGSLAAEQTADSVVFSFAAADHLRQTDAFLSAFRVEARGGGDRDFGGWALELLTMTSLMMDSPAGDDPELRELLEDLELVLAEIVGYAGRRTAMELELIESGLDEGAVQMRVRARLSQNDEAFAAVGAL